MIGVADRPGEDEWALANESVPNQPWHVAVALAGEWGRSGPWGPGRVADWADAVQAGLDTLESAGVRPEQIAVVAAAADPWHPGRCAAITVDGAVVGHAGELHPAVCADLDLPRRTCAMELDLDAVARPDLTPAPTISNFPPALIDVALVVDADIPAGQVETALTRGAGELLESVRLFDVYTGVQVGEGRKSLAYKLVFRAPDRTLTAEEALAARDAAVAAAGELGAILRGV
jgi:phenylalanyl-tRNA synthetase beta chain